MSEVPAGHVPLICPTCGAILTHTPREIELDDGLVASYPEPIDAVRAYTEGMMTLIRAIVRDHIVEAHPGEGGTVDSQNHDS